MAASAAGRKIPRFPEKTAPFMQMKLNMSVRIIVKPRRLVPASALKEAFNDAFLAAL